jgi:hypothetical protein
MEKDEYAIALATSIFAAGFFLGIGTGILLAPHTGSGARGRLKTLAGDLVGDAAKALEDLAGTGRGLPTEPERPAE